MPDGGDDGSRALLVAARAGDREAFAELVRRFADRLLRFLVGRGVEREDARDLVQETFLRAWAALDRFDDRYAVSTWLFTIAYRLALNLRARQARRSHVAIGEAAIAAPAAQAVDDAPPGGLWATARGLLGERDYQALWLYYAEDQDM